jgi:hypothetical protein
MSYRDRPDFDQPTAESVRRSRRSSIWVIPLVVMQQSTLIFRHDADKVSQLIGAIAWTALTIALLWWLLGLPFRWMSQRDQAILNDEWSRSVSGDACRWGIAAAALGGCAMMVARIWVPLDAGLAIFALVNGALLIAEGRYLWLDRAEPAEDE